jgi:hypothetical protein
MKRSALTSILIGTSLFLGITQAHAGPDSDRAKAYFNAIASRNPETIASFYADDAVFHWIGGPLAGVYVGKEKIKEVWKKFSGSIGKLDHEVLQISESASGSAVSAKVKFSGAGVARVKFAMLYREGQIISEVWEADKPRVATEPQPDANQNGPASLAAVPVRADGEGDAPPAAKAVTPEQPKLTQLPPNPAPQSGPAPGLLRRPTPAKGEAARDEPNGDGPKNAYGYDVKGGHDAPYGMDHRPIKKRAYGAEHCDHNAEY